MSTYIKASGVQLEVQIPWIKSGGTWQKLKKIWIKDSGVWRQVFGNTGSAAFSTVGSTSWTPPPGVYSVTVTYPTITSLVTTTLSCTPSVPISVSIGDYGSTSSFGSVTMPVYDKQVFAWSGNIDANLDQTIQVASTNILTYSDSGGNAGLNAGAAAAGLYFNVDFENNHGDLGEAINIDTVPISTLLGTFECYYAYHNGREANQTITAQPTAVNLYRLSLHDADGNRSEGSYNAGLNIRQQGYFSITY
jgi:hypothetical protein